MTTPNQDTTHLLDLLHAGHPQARQLLFARIYDRLRERVHQTFRRRFPDLAADVETDDVLQGAAVRLHRALGGLSQAEPIRDIFAFAGMHIRNELLDLCRRYRGTAKRAVNRVAPDSFDLNSHAESDEDLLTPEQWEQLHVEAGNLPEAERKVFHILFYGTATQEEAAAEIGVDVRTIRRRLREARSLLLERVIGNPPSA